MHSTYNEAIAIQPGTGRTTPEWLGFPGHELSCNNTSFLAAITVTSKCSPRVLALLDFPAG